MEKFEELIKLLDAIVEKYDIAEEDYVPVSEVIGDIYMEYGPEEEVVDEEEGR